MFKAQARKIPMIVAKEALLSRSHKETEFKVEEEVESLVQL